MGSLLQDTHQNIRQRLCVGRRMGGANQEVTLAGRDDADADGSAPADRAFVAPDRDPSAAPHFVPECFFLTQRAMHNLLMPAGAAACWKMGRGQISEQSVGAVQWSFVPGMPQ